MERVEKQEVKRKRGDDRNGRGMEKKGRGEVKGKGRGRKEANTE